MAGQAIRANYNPGRKAWRVYHGPIFEDITLLKVYYHGGTLGPIETKAYVLYSVWVKPKNPMKPNIK